MQFSYTVSFFHWTNKRRMYSYILCLYLCVSLLTKGVSAPPTMVIPREELVLGISTCDTSPSRTGSRVMPVKYEKKYIYSNVSKYKDDFELVLHFLAFFKNLICQQQWQQFIWYSNFACSTQYFILFKHVPQHSFSA